MKKRKYILIIFILLICIFPQNIHASNMMNFENLTIDTGLSQATVEAIAQDDKGYIWLGTNDGLNRYNGSDIKIFKTGEDDSDNNIISNYITALATDKKGNLWIGTDQGISRMNLDDYTVKNYRYSKSDNKNPFYAILTFYVDKDGKLYMGNNAGLYVYNEKNDDFDKVIDLEHGLIDENIYSITQDKQGYLWLGTNQGLEKLNLKNKKVTHYSVGNTDTASWGKIRTIFFNDENEMWVGTAEQGLKVINTKTNEIKSYEMDENDSSKLQSNSVRKIMKDGCGTIWIGTEGGLSKYIDDGKFITYKNKSYDNSTLASNIIYTIIEDESGLVWIGTYTGVSIFDSKNSIEIYKNDPIDTNSLSDNVVMGVYEDKDGLLWIGTRDKGLNIIDRDNEKINHLTEGNTDKELTSNSITMITGKDNIIWVATRNGLNKINKDNMIIEKYTTEDGLIDNNIKSLLLDSNNRLWIGTPMGLSILDINTNKIIDMTSKLIDAGIKEPYIQTVFEDKEGIIWLGGYICGGLVRIDTKQETIKLYESFKNDNKEFIINTIRCIVEDDKNNLWIGTNNGLLKFNKKKESFKLYTQKDGLPNNIIYQILKEENDDLWMSTNNGISKFDIKNNKFINLSSTDGLQSNEFNANAAYGCKNGDVLFGGIKGLNIFNPNKVLQYSYNSKINFDGFEVSGKNYLNIDGKTFKREENYIRIKFFVTDYRKNNNIQYYYKLEKTSNEWRPKNSSDEWIPINSNEVIFSDLDPGKYNFAIKFRTNNGNMSEEKNITFTIKPPIWLSDVAICIYVIIILAIVYNSINKMKKLDKLVNKKTKELNDEMKKNKVLFEKVIEAERSKNNYFINLSHELRTPLNVINSIEQLIRSLCNSDKELTKSKLVNYMDIMKSNTDRLLNLINNIIDTSKIENGRYKLNKEKDDIVYIVEEAALTLKQSIESSGINLIIDTDVEEKIIDCDKCDIERCIVNLVGNAQKFTPQGGSIMVNIKDLGESVKITVEDTGIGIDKKYHDSIFDRFNQVVDENCENKGGSGLGLTITKRIIDLHNGKIYVESEKNKGTKFTIILPEK